MIYPTHPGHTDDDTSLLAAEAIEPIAGSLRAACLMLLRGEPLSADEMAYIIGASPFTIRPRVSELFRLGLIEKTTGRRRNKSGKLAVVWRAAILEDYKGDE